MFGGSAVQAIAGPVTAMAPLTSREIVDDEIHDDLPTPKIDPTIGKVAPSRKRPVTMKEDPDDLIPF